MDSTLRDILRIRLSAINQIRRPTPFMTVASETPTKLQLRRKIELLTHGRRLTPTHRRIIHCLLEGVENVGLLSSAELANLANVSQPSVSRFAMALGYSGFQEMRADLREPAPPGILNDGYKLQVGNKFQAAIEAEIKNLGVAFSALQDISRLQEAGRSIMQSRPFPVLGARASSGYATQFAYYAAKIHPFTRLISDGGSLVDDHLEQNRAMGATTLLTFLLPLYPLEVINSLKFAKNLGYFNIVITDASKEKLQDSADIILPISVNSSLVFDSSCSANMTSFFLLESMSDAAIEYVDGRLQASEQSTKKRRVFAK
ncbi:MurR/RpiR family transcriptional regulator [Verminephrobacter aporrectodeae subsp. tuberculatae]|nr:MurR/RpiR family transcriptional regulator [Verminephrobacter aporrectodeae subsp. tuberculatae]MCW8168137.1 MurR/RpiR family transcriptional regulator [Verminephrobacter aporrectodeae subsp. tuberculatae]